MANKKYVVADKGYVRKSGKIYQTGKEVELTEKEYENVKDYVVEKDSKEGKILLIQTEEQEEAQKQADEQKAAKEEDEKAAKSSPAI